MSENNKKDNVVSIGAFMKKEEPTTAPPKEVTVEDIRNAASNEEAAALFPQTEDGRLVLPNNIIREAIEAMGLDIVYAVMQQPGVIDVKEAMNMTLPFKRCLEILDSGTESYPNELETLMMMGLDAYNVIKDRFKANENPSQV